MPDISRLLGNKFLLALAIIYSLGITVLFLMPTSDLPKMHLPGGFDKFVHLLIHFGLVCLWQLYLLKRYKNTLPLKSILFLLAAILIYGIVIELLQGSLTVSRTADYNDVVANFSGALLGVLVFRNVKRYFAP